MAPVGVLEVLQRPSEEPRHVWSSGSYTAKKGYLVPSAAAAAAFRLRSTHRAAQLVLLKKKEHFLTKAAQPEHSRTHEYY